MKQTSVWADHYTRDLAETLRNRERLNENANLLYWYKQLYREQFRVLRHPERLTILEIGSGVSPLSRFHPNVKTSDVLELDYLDYVFDCHQIDQLSVIADQSLDVITLTNVLHHLKRPIEFLNRAASKLKPRGLVIATEPYFSALSTLIYKYLHHEPVDFSIEKPELSEVRGPLSSANGPLSWMIFERPEWRRQLERVFEFDYRKFRPFTAISYFVTGGISRRIPLPSAMYRPLLAVDLQLSRLVPKLLASFFTIKLTKK